MAEDTSNFQMRDTAQLRAGYSPAFRVFEILSILTFFALMGWNAWRLLPYVPSDFWLLISASLAGWVAADFISGFVHWLADTWGTFETPLVGKTFLRAFREHHVDPEAIAHHDFIELNGANCFVTLLVLVPVLFADPLNGALPLFGITFVLSLSLWTFFTNMIHAATHRPKNPAVVEWLMKAHLIMGREHHQIHHTPPFAKYYCITTGWLNPILTGVSFFRVLEKLVTWTTGMLPRQDDIGMTAALELARAEGIARKKAEEAQGQAR